MCMLPAIRRRSHARTAPRPSVVSKAPIRHDDLRCHPQVDPKARAIHRPQVIRKNPRSVDPHAACQDEHDPAPIAAGVEKGIWAWLTARKACSSTRRLSRRVWRRCDRTGGHGGDHAWWGSCLETRHGRVVWDGGTPGACRDGSAGERVVGASVGKLSGYVNRAARVAAVRPHALGPHSTATFASPRSESRPKIFISTFYRSNRPNPYRRFADIPHKGMWQVDRNALLGAEVYSALSHTATLADTSWVIVAFDTAGEVSHTRGSRLAGPRKPGVSAC
jgi:hypothetical protein